MIRVPCVRLAWHLVKECCIYDDGMMHMMNECLKESELGDELFACTYLSRLFGIHRSLVKYSECCILQ